MNIIERNVKNKQSRSSRDSNSNHTPNEQIRNAIQNERLIAFQSINYTNEAMINLSDVKHKKDFKNTQIFKIKSDDDEDQILDDQQYINVQQEDEKSSDSSETELDHLQKSSENYGSYLNMLKYSKLNGQNQYICRVYGVQLNNDRINFISEKSSESFQEIMKLRLANRASFNEEELICIAHDILKGLEQIEQKLNNLRIRNDNKSNLQKQIRNSSELLYLSPENIGIFIDQKKKNNNQGYQFKIQSYFEWLIIKQKCSLIFQFINSEQIKKQSLIEQIFKNHDDMYYYSPELFVQLFENQDEFNKDILSNQEKDDADNYDFISENNQLDEEIQITQVYFFKINFDKKKKNLTCSFKGAQWSLGMMLLRCLYSSQGDFLKHIYPQQQKLDFIADLLQLSEYSQNNSCLFQPVFLVEIDQNQNSNLLQPWITGQMQQTNEFSWAFKNLISQLLTFDVKKRPSTSELIESPIFDFLKNKLTENKQPVSPIEPISLGVFLSLMKLGLLNQVIDRFFSENEIIDFLQEIIFGMIENEIKSKNSLRSINRAISIESFKSLMKFKVNQVCTEIRQSDSSLQQLNVEELVHRLQRLSQIPQIQRKNFNNKDEDALSMKSEIVKSKQISINSPKIEEAQESKDPSLLNQNQQLSNNMISKLNIFSRVGNSIFNSKSKRSDSPDQHSTRIASDSQSNNEKSTLTPLTVKVAQMMLLKLLSTASEKNFKAFMCRFTSIMQCRGEVYTGVRKNAWPRALNVTNEQAQRELIDLTMSVCGWHSMSKYQDFLQIDRDIPRVHQYNYLANSYYGKILISKALKAFVCISDYNYYIQGMDCMMLILLISLENDWQLAVLCLNEFYRKKIIMPIEEITQQLKYEESEDEIIVKDDLKDKIFREAFSRKLQHKVLIYKWLLTFLDPQLYNHLEQVGFHSNMYVVSWFTNFFSMDFEIVHVIKIWDCLLLSDDLFEVFFAASIMCELRETLLLKDSNGIMSCIKNLQGIINIQLCLQYAQNLSQILPRGFTTVTYASKSIQNDIKQQPNEFIQERPWETPPLFNKLEEKICFQLNLDELFILIKDARNLHPSHLLMFDVRTSKQYEELCISGSIYGNIINNKISNPYLLKYIEIKNQLTGTIDQFKDQNISNNPQIDNIFQKRNSPAHKPIGFVIIIWDYSTQINEIDRILQYLIANLQCRRVCLLKGGIQAAKIDGNDLIKYKNKTALPIFIKKELDELNRL